MTDRYMSDHKDRMENDTEVEQNQNYHNPVYSQAYLDHQLQKAIDENNRKWEEDPMTIEHYENITQDAVQKARHDWLREEIVRLEGMKIMNQKKKYDGNDIMSACDAYNCAFLEWGEVIRYEHGHDHAIQTIIDRYLRELNERGV